MLLSNRALVRAQQPSLQQRDHPMDARKQMLSLFLMALYLAVMNAPCPPNRPGIGSRTPWTGPSAGPTQCREVLNTGFLGAEAPFQLQQSPRIILVHGPKHYILGLVASSKYPYFIFMRDLEET